MATIISTADVPEPNRFSRWREILAESYFPLDLERSSSRPFTAEIATTRLNEFSLTHVRGGEYRVLRTPRRIREARDEFLLVSVQLSGRLWLAQDGREATLNPGDLACSDSTRPYTAGGLDDFETLTLHVPRNIWLRRFGPTEPLTALAMRGNTHSGAVVSEFLRQFASVAGYLETAAAQRFSEVALTLVTGALADLIGEGQGRHRAGRTALLYRAKALVEENLHDPALNREQVARALGISVRYLQDLFLQEDTTVCD